MPEYRRHYLEGHPVFVTLVTFRRRPWLADISHAELLLTAMRRVKSKYPYRHHAHAVMPDHLHWMFEPVGGNFSRVIAAVKRDVSWRLKEGAANVSPPYWQPRFYDHLIRDEEDWRRHLDYIHFNPVKHGVCADPGLYPHSSFEKWCERGVYVAGWGKSEPRDIANMNLE